MAIVGIDALDMLYRWIEQLFVLKDLGYNSKCLVEELRI